MRKEVSIRKTGVKDIKGMASERGECFMALMYKMRAIISRGARRRMLYQKTRFRVGMWIKGSIGRRKGMVKVHRAQPTRYTSQLSFRTFLLKASLVA
jgi:hypothetical protein